MKKPPARETGLRLERRSDGVAIVWLDVPGERLNTLKAGFMKEFADILEAVRTDPELKGVVFASGKPGTFIAGADINLFKQVRTAEEGTRLSRDAQEFTHVLEKFRGPVVAAINGLCLGGGLELALACRARIASKSAETRLGLPEVRLGILPGAGGTQRLPRLIGPESALDMILTGRTISSRSALKRGLVDEVVPAPLVVDIAVKWVHKLAKKGPDPTVERQGSQGFFGRFKSLLLEDNPLGREVLFKKAREKVLAKTHGNMPAPERALEAVRAGFEKGPERGYQVEAEEFGKLAVSPEARNLIDLFFATTELKKDAGTDDPRARARKVRKVGVLGAGLMGAGIATVTAFKAELPVRLKDVGHEPLRRGLRAIRGVLGEQVKKRRITERDLERVMARVGAATDYSGFKRADVVIEAVVENLDVKRSVLREMEANGGREAIFASNTSSLPIDQIAKGGKHPDRVIGMHYFSPVDKMPLLEVIVGKKTASWVTATCVKLGQAQGKTVIVVRDGPGFYTTRILAPFVNEAGHLLAEENAIQEIDRRLVQFGFPVGPVKLLDEVGIDTGLKISKILQEAFGDRMAPVGAMEKVVAAGRYGRKNRSGFYRYIEGESGKGERSPDSTVYEVMGVQQPGPEAKSEDIEMRCVLPMVNEAVRCYSEGILRSARDGDVGAVMGLGFPPFLGGPFRYVDARGAGTLVEMLEGFRARFGDRFEPAPLLKEMASRKLKFYEKGAPPPGKGPKAATRRKSRG